MRLVTDVSTWLDGAWIIGFVEFKDSADQIFMFVCIEGAHYKGSTQNLVGGWRVTRTATEGVYQVLYAFHNITSDTWYPGIKYRSRVEWDERAAADRRSVTNLIDVSECW